MKSKSLKTYAIAASILVGIGHSAISSAHEQIDSLGEAIGSTDWYIVWCSGGTGRLIYSINAPGGAGLVYAMSYFDGRMTSTVDPVSGDGQPGPVAYLLGFDGPYFVAVSKTAAGPQGYRLTYHCESSGGAHTETSITQYQNQ
jgi:hypothetical protein